MVVVIGVTGQSESRPMSGRLWRRSWNISAFAHRSIDGTDNVVIAGIILGLKTSIARLDLDVFCIATLLPIRFEHGVELAL